MKLAARSSKVRVSRQPVFQIKNIFSQRNVLIHPGCAVRQVVYRNVPFKILTTVSTAKKI